MKFTNTNTCSQCMLCVKAYCRTRAKVGDTSYPCLIDEFFKKIFLKFKKNHFYISNLWLFCFLALGALSCRSQKDFISVLG